jgi:hypothetical protein
MGARPVSDPYPLADAEDWTALEADDGFPAANIEGPPLSG